MMSVFNEARKETWSEIQGLSDDVINTKPGKDEWSIQEVLDHLKKIDLKTAQLFKENIRSAPLKAIQAKPVEASENRYDKRKAPDFLEPERKTKDCLTIKTELDHARQQLTSIIASFHKADFQRCSRILFFWNLRSSSGSTLSAIMKNGILNRFRTSKGNYHLEYSGRPFQAPFYYANDLASFMTLGEYDQTSTRSPWQISPGRSTTQTMPLLPIAWRTKREASLGLSGNCF